GVVGVEEVIHVLRRDAPLLGLDRGDDGPVDHLRPLAVTVAHGGAERLLGEDLREDGESVRTVGVGGPQTGELAHVRGPTVACALLEGLLERVHILEGANLPVETESGRFGRGVAFRGRAARRADDDAVHVLDAGELTGIDQIGRASGKERAYT